MNKIIIVEGSGGVGKTTFIDNLCLELDRKGVDYVELKFPLGTDTTVYHPEVAKNIKANIVRRTYGLNSYAVAFDMLKQQVEEIRCKMYAYDVVIVDRAIMSTYIYQLYEVSNGWQEFVMLAKFFAASISEGFDRVEILNLVLDIDLDTVMQRKLARMKAPPSEEELAKLTRYTDWNLLTFRTIDNDENCYYDILRLSKGNTRFLIEIFDVTHGTDSAMQYVQSFLDTEEEELEELS
jgi:thymidylate kinase